MILFSKSKELSFTWILSFHFLPQAYKEGRGKTHSISYGLERSEWDSWTHSLGPVVSRGVTWSTEALQKMQNQAFLLSLIVGIEVFEKQLRISKAKLFCIFISPLRKNQPSHYTLKVNVSQSKWSMLNNMNLYSISKAQSITFLLFLTVYWQMQKAKEQPYK